MSDVNLPASAPAEPAHASAPQMSTGETLANIFFEPEGTFAALRERPRFLVAGLVILLLSVLMVVLVMQKVNFTEFITEQIRSGPQSAQLTEQQKEAGIKFWTGPVGTFFVYGMPFIAIAFSFAAGAALYMLATLVMGGRMGYKQALSVWVYSSLPPSVIGSVVAALLLFLKPAEEIDLNKPGAGLAVTNLGALLGSDSSRPLRAVLSWFDIFTFYGMFLAAVGLRKVGKLSAGAAWTIVIVFWLLCVAFAAIRALAFGG